MQHAVYSTPNPIKYLYDRTANTLVPFVHFHNNHLSDILIAIRFDHLFTYIRFHAPVEWFIADIIIIIKIQYGFLFRHSVTGVTIICTGHQLACTARMYYATRGIHVDPSTTRPTIGANYMSHYYNTRAHDSFSSSYFYLSFSVNHHRRTWTR
jgi:hypothetical protein